MIHQKVVPLRRRRSQFENVNRDDDDDYDYQDLQSPPISRRDRPFLHATMGVPPPTSPALRHPLAIAGNAARRRHDDGGGGSSSMEEEKKMIRQPYQRGERPDMKIIVNVGDHKRFTTIESHSLVMSTRSELIR